MSDEYRRMTSPQHWYHAGRGMAEKDRTFLEMMEGPLPLTLEEMETLVEKRPALWSRYLASLKRRGT